MEQTTIKISKEAHKRLREHKKKTGMPITFAIDKALNIFLGKKKQ